MANQSGGGEVQGRMNRMPMARRVGFRGLVALLGALVLGACATTGENPRASLDASVRCAAGESVACRAGSVERYVTDDPWAAYHDPWYRERLRRERLQRDRYDRGRYGMGDLWTDPWSYLDPFSNARRWDAPGYWHDPRFVGGRDRRDPGRGRGREPVPDPGGEPRRITPPSAPEAPPPALQPPLPPPETSAPPDPPARAPHPGAMPPRPPRTAEP
jgi:hypothetical protein